MNKIQRLREIAEKVLDGNSLEDVMECADALEAQEARIKALEDALTPYEATKAAYIGEFSFDVCVGEDDGEDIFESYTVPWTTTKEIMSAILDFALTLSKAPSIK